MKADPEKAQSIGFRLISYKDALAKQRVGVLDTAALQEILHDASHDVVVAEQELVMAWRFYTQEREQQIACGEFQFCSSPDEIKAARRFSRAKEIIFDPANIKGVASIESQIVATIKQDVLMDAIKWQAVEAHDSEVKNKIRAMYQYGSSSVEIPLEILDPHREEFVERSLHWCKSKSENQFRKYYGDRIHDAIRRMLEEYRDYWAQRPTEPYDDNALNHVFAFSIYGGNYGLGSLFCAWDLYLENRIQAHDHRREPFGKATEEERALNKEEKRKPPIKWPHSHPNAREIIESHIGAIIREDILADTEKWERHKRQYEEAKERFQQNRLQRIEGNRKAFVSKVRSMFGQQVLALISEEDIHRYSVGIVDRRESEEELWYSILSQYDFDQNTKSCVYFIRQGNAIKIGFTDNLDRRLAQIKTSASLPCKIENAVYTHHAKKVERMLHKVLADYNSHLEWFELPSRIEKMLFAAKSVEDVENVLTHITGEDSSDLNQGVDA